MHLKRLWVEFGPSHKLVFGLYLLGMWSGGSVNPHEVGPQSIQLIL
jgi:hypothetical protein